MNPGDSETIHVPLLDVAANNRPLREALRAAIDEVCDSGRFILGPVVERFERAVAEYCGVGHAVGMSSGTDALLAALMAFDIGPGDAVVTTPYTFFATAGAVARLGARPVFCDIDPVSFNLDPDAVAAYLARAERRGGHWCDPASGARLRALLPVHLYGQCADMARFRGLAAEYGLHLIEDAAQALGARDRDGRRAGALGEVACFSFFPSKNLGGFGDGGMCVTDDPVLAERLRILRVHGSKPKYHHALIGGNFRLDALQAAVLAVKLPHLDDWIEARRRNAAWYREAFRAAGLDEMLTAPTETPGCFHTFNQFVVRAADRDRLRAHLDARGVGSEIYYPVPLHCQACFAELGYRPEDCPEALRAAAETLALPIYPELGEAQRRRVVDVIADFYGRG